MLDVAARVDQCAAFMVGQLWGAIEFPSPFGRDLLPEVPSHSHTHTHTLTLTLTLTHTHTLSLNLSLTLTLLFESNT